MKEITHDAGVLVDTSVVIDFLRQQNKRSTLFHRLARQAKKSDQTLSVSMITYAELYAGMSIWSSKQAQRDIGILLSGMAVVPISLEISKLAGKYRALHGLDLIDGVIAATTVLHTFRLSTLNKKHFKNVPDLEMI